VCLVLTTKFQYNPVHFLNSSTFQYTFKIPVPFKYIFKLQCAVGTLLKMAAKTKNKLVALDSGQGWWVKATLSFTERTQATGVQGSVTFVNLLLAVRMPT